MGRCLIDPGRHAGPTARRHPGPGARRFGASWHPSRVRLCPSGFRGSHPRIGPGGPGLDATHGYVLPSRRDVEARGGPGGGRLLERFARGDRRGCGVRRCRGVVMGGSEAGDGAMSDRPWTTRRANGPVGSRKSAVGSRRSRWGATSGRAGGEDGPRPDGGRLLERFARGGRRAFGPAIRRRSAARGVAP